MKKLRVGQFGIGHDHAPAAFGSVAKQKDLFEVVGWCPGEGEEERAAKAGGKYKEYPCLTFEQLMNADLDAAVVETDDWNLTRYAQAALDAGLHVQMDKPGGIDQADFEKMASTAKRKGLVFHTGYMYRYNPFIRKAIADAKAGELGEIYAVEAHMDCLHKPEKRQWLAHFPGGMLYFLGCHLIDLIVQIQGVPEEIFPCSTSTGLDGVTGEDNGMALLRYARAWSFAKTSACEPGGFLRRQLVVCGSKKTVELRPLEEYVPNSGGLQITRARVASDPGWHVDGERLVSEGVDRYDAMLADFAAMARGEKENEFTPEYECRLHRIILACCGVKDVDWKAEIKL